jgi:hypothetical protein
MTCPLFHRRIRAGLEGSAASNGAMKGGVYKEDDNKHDPTLASLNPAKNDISTKDTAGAESSISSMAST